VLYSFYKIFLKNKREWGTPLYGLPSKGTCGPKGWYDFSAVLVINRVWFLHSILELGMFFRRGYFSFSSLSIRP